MQLIVTSWFALAQVWALGDQPEVHINQGTLKGLWHRSAGGRPYAAFLGVPYGKPPIGKLRFQAPVPADPWLGDYYNATRDSPKCLQFNHMTMNTPHPILGSEDCLYLSVYTPKINEDKLMDVIVFIHGGAFMFGASSLFGGSYLMDRDVVLVTVSYRLGPLGFMSTGDAILPGNNGMKDQALALRWVHDNIAAFGGNPDKITMTGFSAGGASVHYHTLSPLSKGLIKHAICASGSTLNPWTQAENAREKAHSIARGLGCPTEDTQSMVDCLRDRPAVHIVAKSQELMHWHYNPISPYALVVEPPSPNAFLPDTPINLLRQRKGADVPILFTFDKDEGLYPGAEFVGNADILMDLAGRLEELLPFILEYNYTAPNEEAKREITQKIIKQYNIDLHKEQGVKNFVQTISDRLFMHGIVKAAKLHANLYSSPIYLYQFSYIGENSLSSAFGGPKDLGVCHADDIMYILENKIMNTQETESDRQMSKFMVDLWVSFAANGSLDGLPFRENLPNIVYTDILGPSHQESRVVKELGREKFWDSLGLLENLITDAREEL